MLVIIMQPHSSEEHIRTIISRKVKQTQGSNHDVVVSFLTD